MVINPFMYFYITFYMTQVRISSFQHFVNHYNMVLPMQMMG